MAVKHFHSRRSHRGVAVLSGLVLLTVVVVLVLLNFRGPGAWAAVIAGAVVIGLVVAYFRKRRQLIAYELHGDGLVLRRGGEEARYALQDVLDANLIDMPTARNYIRHGAGSGQGGADGVGQVLTTFCAVPLRGIWAMRTGLSNMGMSHFRHSLVLLRTRDGGALVLSPRYSEPMVSAIAKALARLREGMSGTVS